MMARDFVFCVVLFQALLLYQVSSSGLGLEKIFRTPKKVNFDDLELVERNGFDKSESTTQATTESPELTTTPQSNHNIATAQVLLRIGGEEAPGHNHIMKIPPQCRHMSHPAPLNHPAPPNPHDLYYPPFSHRYPPTCHPQFYHPYPPPVPFAFPNYYFYDYGASSNLPPQLNEYFLRQPNVVVKKFPGPEQVFIRGRPVRRRGEAEVEGDTAGLIIAREPTAAAAQNSTTIQVKKIILIHPRGTDQANLTTEEGPGTAAEEKLANASKSVKNLKELKRKTKKVNLDKVTYEEEDLDVLENLLSQALVTYKKHHNCSSANSTKQVLSYPIFNRNESMQAPNLTFECPLEESNSSSTVSQDMDDLDCQECQNSSNKNPLKDLDDLAVIVAEYIVPEPEPIYAARSYNSPIPYNPYAGGRPRYVLLPNQEQTSGLYCSKCGYRHNGGNYCDQCGYPVMVGGCRGCGRCPHCSREVRQLSDW